MDVANHENGADPKSVFLTALKSERDGPTEQKHESTVDSNAKAETPEAPQKNGGASSDTETGEELYTVKYKGEEKQVTREELTKGYMMELDYRTKTSELAKKRREFEEELISFTTDQRALTDDDLKWIESDEAANYYGDNWREVVRNRLEAKKERLEKLKEKEKSVNEARYNERIRAEQVKLTEFIPEWLDESKAHEDYAGIAKTVEEYGQDASTITDAWIMALARKAFKYDKIMSAKPEDKIVKKAGKNLDPGKSKSVDDVKRDSVLASKEKLTKEPTRRGQKSAFMNILKHSRG